MCQTSTYTKQYSYIADDATDIGSAGFGLMFYNARWYDPQLGRFAQADTIVPGGPQGMDRYAYVNNNPVNGVDPSGHATINECERGQAHGYACEIVGKRVIDYTDWRTQLKEKYGWTVWGNWSQLELSILYQVAQDIESVVGGVDTMRKMLGDVDFSKETDLHLDGRKANAVTTGNHVTLDEDFEYLRDDANGYGVRWAIAHELGHVWDNNTNNDLGDRMHTELHSSFGPGGSPGRGPGATGWIPDATWNKTGDFGQSFAAYVYPEAAAQYMQVRHPDQGYCSHNGPHFYCYANYRDTPRGQFIANNIPTP